MSNTYKAMMPYEKLEAWKACHLLVLAVYTETRSWPSEERFGLTSQARRAAVSAATNIAEGVAKRGQKEFRRYLDISLGSLSELSYLLRLAKELGFSTADQANRLSQVREVAGRTTWKLYAAISRL
ncbi:MAG: four helix bundle protein [Gemmatimonadota bacterium]